MKSQHPIFDTHAHYHDSRFSSPDTGLPQVDVLLNTLFSTEISHIINVGTDIPHSMAAIALAERYTNMYAVIGMYPGSCPLPFNEEQMEDIIAQFSAMLDHEKLSASAKSALIFITTMSRAAYRHTGLTVRCGLPKKRICPSSFMTARHTVLSWI